MHRRIVATVARVRPSAVGRRGRRRRAARAAPGRKSTARRSEASANLKRRTEAELKTLGMRSPAFEPRVTPIAADQAAFTHDGLALGAAGADDVEFHIAPNLGQPAMALGKIASGGELSRVMLALKRLEAQRRGVATIVEPHLHARSEDDR